MNSPLLRSDIPPLLKKDNGFDIIRYYLSFAVLFAHFATLTDSPAFFPTASSTAVGGFFILSGFLVFYSYLRSPSLKHYLIRRAKRILPPYVAIVILCALCGVFLTNLSAKEYFTSPTFFRYLASNLCMANFLQPTLPGVFSHNILPYVNGSLWTMKVEVLLYLSVPITAYLLRKQHKLLIFIGIYTLSYLYKLWMGHLYETTGETIYEIMQRQVIGQLLYFYSGVILLFYFDYLQRNIRILFPLAAIVAIASNVCGWVECIEPMAIAIIIIGFAYNSTWFTWMRKYDNIAYDIYLFHFPIIQLVLHWGIPQYNTWLALCLVIVLTILLSLLSWHIIERPIMKRR